MMRTTEETVELYNQLADDRGVDVKPKYENLSQYLVSFEDLEDLHQKFYGTGNISYKTTVSDDLDDFYRNARLDIEIPNTTIKPEGDYVSGLTSSERPLPVIDYIGRSEFLSPMIDIVSLVGMYDMFDNVRKNQSNATVHFDVTDVEHSLIDC